MIKKLTMDETKVFVSRNGLKPGCIKGTDNIVIMKGNNKNVEIIDWNDFEHILEKKGLAVYESDGSLKIFKVTKIREQQKQTEEEYRKREFEKNKRKIELEIKGFTEKEIDAILNYGYNEQQIKEMRDPNKKIETTNLIPQQSTIHIEKIESLEKLESIVGNKIDIRDSLVQKSQIDAQEKSMNNCPFCGKKFNFTKTPNYCPYCNRKLE
jgi:hypothetical protein